jgi:hypothetical protein
MGINVVYIMMKQLFWFIKQIIVVYNISTGTCIWQTIYFRSALDRPQTWNPWRMASCCSIPQKLMPVALLVPTSTSQESWEQPSRKRFDLHYTFCGTCLGESRNTKLDLLLAPDNPRHSDTAFPEVYHIWWLYMKKCFEILFRHQTSILKFPARFI